MSIAYNEFDSDDDDWRPMDYTSDTDHPPPDIDHDPPPQDINNNIAPPVDTQMDADEMPIIDEPPPPVEKKTRGKKAKSDVPPPVKQSKEDHDMDVAIDRFMTGEYNVPERKPPPSKKAVKGEKKSKPPSGKEDVEKHQALLMQVDRYRMSERFKDVIRTSGLRMSGIEDCSIEELQDLLTRIRTVVGNRTSGGGNILGTGILMATHTVETMPITQRFADIRGLSAMLSEDPEFADIAEQLSIDYSIMSVMSPEKRLALLMIKSGMRMNSINNMKASILSKAAAVQPPPPVIDVPIVRTDVDAPAPVIAPRVNPLQETMRSY